MSIYHLRKIYTQSGIKNKKIRRTKIMTLKQKIKSGKEAVLAKEKVNELRALGYEIYYADEFCTTKSTIPTHCWSLPN